jgi:squalene-hopene/tetraprenyl-beta-curcumene cyclase
VGHRHCRHRPARVRPAQRSPGPGQCCEWLLDREVRFRGDWQYKNPADVEPSGWVFEFNNKWNPDVDDTAMVLLALRKIPTANPARRDAVPSSGG